MGKINSITKQTDNRYVNLYNVKATSVHNTPVNYFVSSRAKDVDSLKMVTHKNNPDGVIIYSIYGEKHDKVVLIRQYRYTLGDYIYEFPAGLVEPDENYHEGAIREMYEETGLKLDPIPVAEAYQKPYFTTVGMTDESCATVYGYASGEISSKAQEDTEEIEVILADREEVKRILKEENVAIMTKFSGILLFIILNILIGSILIGGILRIVSSVIGTRTISIINIIPVLIVILSGIFGGIFCIIRNIR